jgi:quinol monooxygenase YgiN
MTRDTIQVVAILEAGDGKADALREVAHSILEPTRAEDGCIRYELFQDSRDENVLVFVEEWRDQAALRAHGGRDHMVEAQGKMKDLLAGKPVLRFCRHIG